MLAKAGICRKSYSHCAARGPRADQRFAGEIIAGTCNNGRFYNGFGVIGYHSNDTWYSIDFEEMRADFAPNHMIWAQAGLAKVKK